MSNADTAIALNLNSNSAQSIGAFGSQTVRFQGNKENTKVPGPGNYIPHAGSQTIDQRSYDKQWSNKSHSARFGINQNAALIETG